MKRTNRESTPEAKRRYTCSDVDTESDIDLGNWNILFQTEFLEYIPCTAALSQTCIAFNGVVPNTSNNYMLTENTESWCQTLPVYERFDRTVASVLNRCPEDIPVSKIYRICVKYHNVGLLQYYEARYGVVPTVELMNCAAKYGVLSIMRYLRERDDPCPWNAWACASAARNDHLHILHYLRERDDPCPWNERACASAAGNGHLRILRYLRERDDPCPWDTWACAEAARNDHLRILRYLRERDDPCPWNERACVSAARNDHLRILRYLRERDDPCPWDAWACTEAARNDHLDILRYLRERDDPCPWDRTTYEYAILANRIEIINYLKEHNAPTGDE